MTTQEKDDHTAEVRAQALMMLGQDAEAARIYQRLYHEKDSVFGRDARQHLDELNTLFQIDELKTEQQRTKFRYTLIAASSIVLALVVLLIFGRRNTIRQKKVNEQLRIANERAIVSSKMKTEFIRNISHEIRTPLNIVSGFTQILTSPDMDLPAGSKRDIQERVTENTDRITKLVDRMLELSDVNNETLIDRNDQTNALNIVSQAIDYSGITLCDGPLPTVGFNAPNFDTPGQVTVSFNANLDINSASADDKVFVFVYCPDAGQGILSPEVKRNDGSTKVTVPEMWNGLKVHLWGFVYSDKLNRKRPNSVSTSNYLGSGNIG
jgi:signal transduction histidine kinase